MLSTRVPFDSSDLFWGNAIITPTRQEFRVHLAAYCPSHLAYNRHFFWFCSGFFHGQNIFPNLFLYPSQFDVWKGLSGGGGAPEAPLSILALEPNSAQKSCFPERWHQFQFIWPLFGNFFEKSPKKSAKIENPSKNGQIWAKFLNFVIFELFQHANL